MIQIIAIAIAVKTTFFMRKTKDEFCIIEVALFPGNVPWVVFCMQSHMFPIF